MPTLANTTTVEQAFFEPLNGLASASPPAQSCPLFSEEEFVRLGVQRVLENSESGRAFLQEHGLRLESAPHLGNYFLALRSPRRGEVLADGSQSLITAANSKLRDRLADIPELSHYECFAADGHWHKAAAHDDWPKTFKMPVGHFYSLNLRTPTLRHLTAGEGLRDHDMTAINPIAPRGFAKECPKANGSSWFMTKPASIWPIGNAVGRNVPFTLLPGSKGGWSLIGWRACPSTWPTLAIVASGRTAE